MQKRVRQQRRKVVNRIGLAALACIVAGWGAWGAIQSQDGMGENFFGGIACRDVGKNLPAYMSGDLGPELAEKIKIHLANCPRCKHAKEMMQAQPHEQARYIPHEVADPRSLSARQVMLAAFSR